MCAVRLAWLGLARLARPVKLQTVEFDIQTVEQSLVPRGKGIGGSRNGSDRKQDDGRYESHW